MSERKIQIAHMLAVEAATKMVKEGAAMGVGWEATLIACETAIAVVVACCAEIAGVQEKERWSAEIIDSMTQHAHLRAVAVIRGVPYTGR